ncbi:MAG TPA: flagellar hook capping FlgD N-terminal domain-containing protein, partial [Parvularculaceae bacterium]|nr:flagellar hook capping FlgD N-terminal domain-containing protein [Parvularculaceae bacterium]
NQDPLSPLDSTQFVQQLASFSAVEQQIETNKLLNQFVGGDAQSTLTSATQWIGKEVEAPVSHVQYSGDPLQFHINPSDKGAAREVIVKNANGDVVYSESVAPGETNFTWSGALLGGGQAANGAYTIVAQYSKDGAAAGTEPMTAIAHVTEARLVDGAISLGLDNGGAIDPSAVTAVRAGAS